MKRWLGIGVAALMAFALVFWWFNRDEEPAADAPKVASVSAAAPVGSGPPPMPAKHLSLLEAPLPAAKGAGKLTGRVVAEGKPVAGAIVVATQGEGEDVLSNLPCGCDNKCGNKLLECGCGEAAGQLMELVARREGEAPPLARVTTGADGTFALEGLPDGALALWAEQPGVAIGVKREVKAGDQDVEIAIAPGVTLRGKVTGDKDEPVAGAQLTAIYVEHSRFFDGVSGPDGTFAIGPVPEGDYSVVAYAEGRLPGNDKAKKGSADGLAISLNTPRSISGRVVQNGAAAAGATVDIEGNHKKLSAKTGEDGAFKFIGLRPGEWSVKATLAGNVGNAKAEVKAGEDVSGVEVSLDAAAQLSGKVTDQDGVPVKDAEISVQFREASSKATSGADGTYRFDALPGGEAYVRVQAKGFMAARHKNVTLTAGAPTTADFKLERGVSIEGVVVDPEGKPVKKARLSAHRDRPKGEIDEIETDDSSEGFYGNAYTKDDGTFAIEGLSPGPFEMLVMHDEFVDAKAKATAPAKGVRIEMKPGLELTGRVVDEKDAPVAGAQVTVAAAEPVAARIQRDAAEPSGSDGRFVVRGLLPARFVVTARLTEKQRTSTDVRNVRVTAADVTLTASGAAPVLLRFEAGQTISGQVLDASGTPVAEVALYARPDLDASSQRDAPLSAARIRSRSGGAAKSNAEGRFRLEHLAAGTYKLTASKEGFGRPEPVTARAGDEDVKLVLSSEGKIRGRVVHEDGTPVTSFKLNRRDIHNADGSFDLPIRRRGGEQELFFEAAGLAPTTRKVTTKAGESVTLPDVVMSGGRTLTGSVVDSSTGAPVSGALVDVGDPDQSGSAAGLSEEYGAARSRADGTFSLPHVEKVALKLYAAHPDYTLFEQPLAPGETTVVVRMKKGGSIVGRVLDASGKPVRQGMVVAIGDKTRGTAEMEDEGRFTLKGLKPGRYTVRVGWTRPERSFPTPTVEVGAEPVSLELREVTGGVEVTLALPTIADRERLHAVLIPGDVPLPTNADAFEAFGGAIEVRDGSDGSMRASHVAPGRYTVTVLEFRTSPQSAPKLFGFRQVVDVPEQPTFAVTISKPAQMSEIPIPSMAGGMDLDTEW